MIASVPTRSRPPGNVPPSAPARPRHAAAAGGAPARPVDTALAVFRARFDRLGRDDAGQRGFFLNLLL